MPFAIWPSQRIRAALANGIIEHYATERRMQSVLVPQELTDQ